MTNQNQMKSSLAALRNVGYGGAMSEEQSDKERVARVAARVLANNPMYTASAHTDGWEAGVAWAQAEIAKMLMAHDFDCQSNPGLGCEGCVRENVSGEIEREEWKR